MVTIGSGSNQLWMLNLIIEVGIESWAPRDDMTSVGRVISRFLPSLEGKTDHSMSSVTPNSFAVRLLIPA